MSPDDAGLAIAAALESIRADIPELQVYAYYNTIPTPPSLDVYAATPFMLAAGFGVGNSRAWFTVRALASEADPEAATKLLYRLLDPNGPASVEAALAEDDLAVIDTTDGQISGIQRYADATGCIGCDWRVGVFLT